MNYRFLRVAASQLQLVLVKAALGAKVKLIKLKDDRWPCMLRHLPQIHGPGVRILHPPTFFFKVLYELKAAFYPPIAEALAGRSNE